MYICMIKRNLLNYTYVFSCRNRKQKMWPHFQGDNLVIFYDKPYIGNRVAADEDVLHMHFISK